MHLFRGPNIYHGKCLKGKTMFYWPPRKKCICCLPVACNAARLQHNPNTLMPFTLSTLSKKSQLCIWISAVNVTFLYTKPLYYSSNSTYMSLPFRHFNHLSVSVGFKVNPWTPSLPLSKSTCWMPCSSDLISTIFYLFFIIWK